MYFGEKKYSNVVEIKELGNLIFNEQYKYMRDDKNLKKKIFTAINQGGIGKSALAH